MITGFGNLSKLSVEMQATTSIVGLVFTVLVIIGWWKIFTKAGEAGWKSLIPIYNVYILFKISWTTSAFWKMIIASFLAGVFEYLYLYVSQGLIISLGFLICSVVILVIMFRMNFKLSNAFGHGILFGLGLLFFPYVFELILGFCGSTYSKGSN